MATIAEAFQVALDHYMAGRSGQAEDICLQIVRADRCHAEAFNLLGLVGYQTGRLAFAIESIRRAAVIDPANTGYHNNLGVMYSTSGKPAEAIASFREALRHDPNYADAHNNLGNVYKDQGRLDEAVASYRQALTVKPDYADAHNNLGNALKNQGKARDSIACYQEAVRLKPDFIQAYHNLAVALTEQARPEESVPCYRRALQLKPDFARAYYDLGILAGQGYYTFTNSDICAIKHLLGQRHLSLVERSLAHLTLAGIYQRLESYDEAFTHFRQGNELRRENFRQRGAGYDAEKHRLQADRLIDTFTASYFEQVKSIGCDSELPVFVIGMPRSGTTLVEQILSSHPRVAGAGEMWDIARIVGNLPQATGGEYPACIANLDRASAADFAQDYLKELRVLGGSADRIVDKMPLNFLHLGVIATLFPRARIIHCRRDALDTCASCYFQNFENINFASSLEDLGTYYRQYERLMAHWREVLPGRMFEVRYEQLVANQESVSREMIAHCGLEWDDRCLDFHKNPRSVQTASMLQVRKPMYRSSVGRWIKYANHLQPLVKILEEINTAEEPAATKASVLPAAAPISRQHSAMPVS